MIDFHSHILPNIDDGADSIEMSVDMLNQSFQQGVTVMVATPHFYPEEDYPQAFLSRRIEQYKRLRDALLLEPSGNPLIVLGAEVFYFPGIGQAEEVESLTIGSSRCVLVEPPMAPWSDNMLDDIAMLKETMNCQPIIAHVNRYMTYLKDESLIYRVLERGMQVQVNANYFLNPSTAKSAMKHLKQGNIHLVGSDCHNVTSRPQNLGQVKRILRANGLESEFKMLSRNAALLLKRKG